MHFSPQEDHMQTCEFCGSELPNGASFCGYCGRSPSHATDAPTSGMDLRTIQSSPRNMPNPPHGPAFSSPQQANQPWQQGTPSTPNQRDDEEERRKRAALLGLGL